MKTVDKVFWAVLIVVCAAFAALFVDGFVNAEAIEPEQPQEIACDSEPTNVETITVDEFMARAREAWERVTAQPEEEPEDEYVEEYYYEPVYYGGYTGGSDGGKWWPDWQDATTTHELLNGQGHAYGEDGTGYTWYPNDIGWGSIEGRIPGCHYDDDGVAYDEDGYIAVSADGHEMGEVIDTPYGEAKVYDKGSGHNSIDVYTNR